MIFSLLLFAMFGIVAFFLFTQGFFGATISAILAMVAAVVSLGWYEQVAPLLFNAKMYDQAASISMIVIFAAVFIIPRLIIDALVPGNVRVPFIVEKAGASLMAILGSLVATGVVALAADALPFGPTIGMYSRFDTVDDKNKTYMGINGQMQDSKNNDVITADSVSYDDPKISHVWLRQDDLVVGLVSKVSGENGSLSNDHPMTTVHPDLIDEYYGQRLGIQTGAKHTAVNTEQNQPVSVKGVYAPTGAIPQIDGEQTGMQLSGSTPLPPTLVADGDHIVLVVRMNFSGKELADEADNTMRYSLSTIRLVSGPTDAAKNYYPVAVLDDRGTAVAYRLDDFLLSDLTGGRTIDFIFMVDRDHAMTGDETKVPFHLPQGAFVEFKRYGLCDLSGKQVDFGPPPNPDKTPLLFRPSIAQILAKTDGIWTGAAPVNANSGGGSSPANPQTSTGGGDNGAGAATPDAGNGKPLGDSGLGFVDISVSNKLAVPINCGTGDDNATVQLQNGVGGELAHRQWARLTVATSSPVKTLSEPPSDAIKELAVDPNNVLVQVQCSAPASGSQTVMWAWGKRLSDFALADATGHTYPCVGVWATAQRGADQYFIANYKNFDDKNHIQTITSQKPRPVNVWLAFQVPSGTPIAEIRFSANTVMDNLNLKAQ